MTPIAFILYTLWITLVVFDGTGAIQEHHEKTMEKNKDIYK